VQLIIMRRVVESSFEGAHPAYGTDSAPRENQVLRPGFSSRSLILYLKDSCLCRGRDLSLRASTMASTKKVFVCAGLAKHTIMAKAQSCSKGKLRRR